MRASRAVAPCATLIEVSSHEIGHLVHQYGYALVFLVVALQALGAPLPGTTRVMLMGGHVRVGLEDNNYFARGVLATNEMLVERTVRIARDLNLEVAAAAEARDILGLPQLNSRGRA